VSADYARLLKIVRPQMRRWWRRIGWPWLALLIVY